MSLVFKSIVSTNNSTINFSSKYYRKHRFIGVFEYREPKLMILDPALAVDIYVKYFKYFADNTMNEMVWIDQKVLFAR